MSVGVWQVVLLLVIVLILFGAGKLPRLMGDVGKGIRTFKSGLKDDPPARPATSGTSVDGAQARKDDNLGS